MGARVKLTLSGFDKLLSEIQDAGGEIKPATERALQSSANLATAKIRSGAEARNLGSEGIIDPTVKWNGNRASVEVGYKLGAYNSRDLSPGYKALFTEYGTGKRSTRKGANRGAMKADPFIRPTVEESKKEIVKAQKVALERVLKGLKK